MILSDFVHTTPAILRILFPATEDGVLSSSVPGWWAAGQVSCEPTRISCYQWRGPWRLCIYKGQYLTGLYFIQNFLNLSEFWQDT